MSQEAGPEQAQEGSSCGSTSWGGKSQLVLVGPPAGWALPIGPLVTAGQLCAVFGLCLPLKSCPPNTAGEPHGKRPGLVTLAITVG